MKHSKIYRLHDAALALTPWDWEKPYLLEPLNAYYRSMQLLGDVEGRCVLDAACGDGWLSVILAKRGARVTSFDISPDAIDVARERMKVNGVAERVELHVASFYSMPFEDGSFDAVIGQAVLHHLGDKEQAARELHRVLRPQGRGIFVEPLANSAVLQRLRQLVPVPSGAPEDPDQEQMSYDQIRILEELFNVRTEEFHLLSRLDRITDSPRVVAALNRFDVQLLNRFPFLRRYARAVVIELERRRQAAGTGSELPGPDF